MSNNFQQLCYELSMDELTKLELRIALYVISQQKAVRVYELEEAFHLDKSNISRSCTHLYDLNILSKHTIGGIPFYTFNNNTYNSGGNK